MADPKVDVTNMSDEDFEQNVLPTMFDEPDEAEVDEPSGVTESDDATVEAEDEAAEDENTGTDETEEEEEEDTEESKPEADAEGEASSEETDEAGEEEGKGKGESDGQPAETLEDIFKPFKANGSKMQVNTVDEARTLMQYGANYQKKMTAIKPHLKRVQTLEANNISDDDINLLVDLKKGDQQAIKKLLADHEIEPLDLDLEEASDYKPQDRSISDAQYNLNNVMDNIKGTDSYDATFALMSSGWDKHSRDTATANPAIIQDIHAHMEAGTYAQVVARVERDRALGKLANVYDLDAYGQTWGAMNEEGAFSDQKATPSSTPKGDKSNGNDAAAETSKALEASRNKKRAAAGAGKRKQAAKPKADVPNIMDMSDEDFEKQYGHTLPQIY